MRAFLCKGFAALVGLAVVSGGVGVARAALMEVSFSGTVSVIHATDRYDTNADAAFRSILPFHVGDAYSGVFRYDTDATDTHSDPHIGIYDAILSEVNIGGTALGIGMPRLWVLNDWYGQDQLTLAGGATAMTLPPGWSFAYSGGMGWGFGADMSDSTATALAGEEPPADFALSDFTYVAPWRIIHQTSGSDSHTWTTPLGSFTGHLTDIQLSINQLDVSEVLSSVPEPATLVIWTVLGAGAIVGWRRRKRAAA